MYYSAIAFLALILAATPATAADYQWPYINDTPIITSDFGPRECTKCSKFHRGIDLKPRGIPAAQIMGYPIRAISSGTITRIFQSSVTWILEIQDANSIRKIRYVHIFDSRILSTNTFETANHQWELRRSTAASRNLYIIRKTSGSLAAFSQEDGLDVPGYPGLKTRRSVAMGEAIAPTGNSGTNKPHLHLDIENTRNIFAFLPHPQMYVQTPGGTVLRTSDVTTWTITDQSKICGDKLGGRQLQRIFDPIDQSTQTIFKIPFVAKVDSRNGLDLNQVQFDLSGPAGPFTLGIKNFGGGLAPVPSTGVYSNVKAKAANGFSGVDIFRIDRSQVPADLPNGQYQLKITVTNIAGQSKPPFVCAFEIARSTISVRTSAPTQSGSSIYNPNTGWSSSVAYNIDSQAGLQRAELYSVNVNPATGAKIYTPLRSVAGVSGNLENLTDGHYLLFARDVNGSVSGEYFSLNTFSTNLDGFLVAASGQSVIFSTVNLREIPNIATSGTMIVDPASAQGSFSTTIDYSSAGILGAEFVSISSFTGAATGVPYQSYFINHTLFTDAGFASSEFGEPSGQYISIVLQGSELVRYTYSRFGGAANNDWGYSYPLTGQLPASLPFHISPRFSAATFIHNPTKSVCSSVIETTPGSGVYTGSDCSAVGSSSLIFPNRSFSIIASSVTYHQHLAEGALSADFNAAPGDTALNIAGINATFPALSGFANIDIAKEVADVATVRMIGNSKYVSVPGTLIVAPTVLMEDPSQALDLSLSYPLDTTGLDPFQSQEATLLMEGNTGLHDLAVSATGSQITVAIADASHQSGVISVARPDNTAPTNVDASLAHADVDALSFSWTAPGDDGIQGRASGYDIRYAPCSGTGDFNFAAASPALDDDAEPSPSGSEEMVSLGGLSPNTRYCFGVIVEDIAGNISQLSVASGVTLPESQTMLTSQQIVSGGPELQFQYQQNVELTLTPLPNGNSEVQQYFSLMADKFQARPLSGLYEVGPSGYWFDTAARITFHYDPDVLVQSGFTSSQIRIFESLPTSDVAFVLSDQSIDPIQHTISASVNALSSKFAIFGTTGTASGGGSTDVMPPVTTFTASSSSVATSGTVYINNYSGVRLSAVDDKLILGDGLGVGTTQTFYAIDGGSDVRYSSTFTISLEGSHILSYFSIDLVGNSETANQKSIFSDLTPPVTRLNQNGAEFALDAFDPSIAGGASGVGRIRYLVDVGNPEVCNNVAEDTSAAPGTCENPWYAGPFTLSNGPHTLSFQAFDAVGNAEPLQTAYPYVDSGGNGGPSAGGMGIGKDASNALWTVVLDSGAIAFAHADSSGTMISSATLQDGGSDFPWSVLFGQDGRAYAIGAAEGPETQAMDLAIYKASPAGDAIESRTLFDSGYAKNDIVFDAKSPGWIVGAAQTSGPANLDEPGEITFSMALWRFDPTPGTVQLKTTYARGSFDLAAGLAVDPDGSLWVAGYSLSPENPNVGAFDLALWHYAANGQTLLGGPYLRPGYLNDLDAELATKVYVTTQAVYIAATRVNSAGRTDMAFLRYDKSSGQPIAETAWRSAGGESSYPMAILPEASGMLVVGGIGAESTQAALWRFGFDGALQSVNTTEAGGARGAVFKDSELWLSVDGSTVPYHVESEAAAAGALIDLAPPRSSLSAGTPSFTGELTVYVTSATPLGFAVIDDYTVPGDALGVGATQTFYAEGDDAFARFTSSFTLVAEGTHTVSFFSIDREGRAEAVKTQSVGVDLTAPVVTLVSSGSIFSITTIDPLVNGAASGVRLVQYLVDQDPECNVEPSTAAAPGTCENLTYAGPFELAFGTHTVYYAAEDNLANGLEVVYSSYITVGQPLTGPVLTPSSGPIGVPFSITGTGFGIYGGANTRVKFGALAAPASVWNDTTITGTIPGLSTGAYAVTIERQNVSSVTAVSAGSFAVTDLNSATLNVSSGPIGVPFSITGTGFGPYGGTLTRVLVDGATAPLSVWNNTTISGTIPGVTPGAKTIVIQRAAGSFLSTSDGFAFEVTVPSVTGVSPSSGPIGAAFTLTGFSFGPYNGTNTRVLIGGATAALSLWSDRVIKGTVPGSLSPGVQTVLVQRLTSGDGLVESGAAYFQVAGLAMGILTPSSGPIGVPFTISGSGFGAYDGANTRVKFGVSTAALSLWNDTTITGTVPVLEPGEWPVVIERQQGSSVSASSSATFTATALSVSDISPSSGPIGTAFTLLGPGFGPYAGAASVVLIDGATAALSVWNDAQIIGTIPGSVPSGSRSVIVRRTSGAGESVSAPVYFEVTGLALAGISPSSGPIGAPFTITGSQFGVYGGANTRVKFNGVVAPVSVWIDNQITGTVPALSTGTVDVVVERQQGADVAMSGISTFTVVELAPTAMNPESGPIGTAFTITGSCFGPYNGANTRVLIGGVAAALSLWNDTTITGTIPSLPAGVQPLWLERSAGTGVQSSATSYFNVTTPAVASLTPSSAPIGAPFTITGTSFGAFGGANTRVTFNGVAAALSLWNDTTITGTVPALPAGTVDVVVERLQGTGSAASNASPFAVVEPALGGLSPASGPIGTAFTITGSGFGPYAGANTRVLIGGVAAVLSLWNDTTITGTIPDLPAGAQPVWLERSAGSGVSSSATSYFNVTTPSVAALTPSSAPIGAPFSITGTSFGAYAGANTRVTFNGVVAPLSVWNDTQITGTVPGSLAPGEAEVVVERAAGAGLVTSASQAFYVLSPVISTVSPSYGPVGTVVTVTGSGFGPYSGTLTKLLVGGATVPLSVWNDTTIRWTVPSSLGDGEYPVIVERSPAGGTVQSASGTFTVGTGYSGASFAFAATLSLAATPDTHFEGDMALSSATGGRIDTPAKAAVDIPANAMEADTEITLKRIRGDGLRAAAAEEIQKKAAGEPIEFGPEGTRFNTPVTIELPYDPALTKDETKIAIHYYNPLRREWEELPSVVDRARKVVTAKTDHFSIYQPMGLAPTAAAQDEFYFRDAYAFPNPIRGASLVTFRIQPGLAETVEVRVYDLSGRKIHESSDFTFLGAIDDGNGKGAQNTYDHVWNVSGVGSGVYNFVIKASQRGNKPITKSGKVGVIR